MTSRLKAVKGPYTLGEIVRSADIEDSGLTISLDSKDHTAFGSVVWRMSDDPVESPQCQATAHLLKTSYTMYQLLEALVAHKVITVEGYPELTAGYRATVEAVLAEARGEGV